MMRNEATCLAQVGGKVDAAIGTVKENVGSALGAHQYASSWSTHESLAKRMLD